MKRIISIGLLLMVVMSTIASVSAAEYVVEEGDVLWRIARDYKTTIDQLVDLNSIENRDLIYINQVIQLPEMILEEEKMQMTNSEKAVALIESIGTMNMEAIAYINPENYIQHNLGVADGLAGFGEVASQLPEGSYGRNIRVIEDGDFVIMHNDYNFFGPKIGFDIFRFEEGLIVEHWDNLTVTAEQVNPSGRTQIDGRRTVGDLKKTQENKDLVKGFMDDVLMGAAPEKITDYVSTDEYLQHNIGVADGLDGLGAALTALAEAGTPMVYTENHGIFGQGNFVLSTSEGEFMGEHVAFYDLFRIEDGKIVEHWDVIETIPAEEDWKNSNGKF